MHTGIFASTTTERMAALKEKAAHRQTGIDALKKSTADAEQELAKTRAEEMRLKQALTDTVQATDASADAMHDQLKKQRIMTAAQIEEHARLNVETESNIEQFDALRARYEHLFRILMDKLKGLQRNALEDKETIERLTLERDMYVDELTDTIQTGIPKHSTSTVTMSTQTDARQPKTNNKPQIEHHTPAISSEVPTDIKAQYNRFSRGGFSHWEEENRDFTNAIRGEKPQALHLKIGIFIVVGLLH